jgi:hypothetical protein
MTNLLKITELTAGINADIAQAQKKLSELKQQFRV